MSKMIKKEKRGAIKEIRKDNTFIAQLVILSHLTCFFLIIILESLIKILLFAVRRLNRVLLWIEIDRERQRN